LRLDDVSSSDVAGALRMDSNALRRRSTIVLGSTEAHGAELPGGTHHVPLPSLGLLLQKRQCTGHSHLSTQCSALVLCGLATALNQLPLRKNTMAWPTRLR